MGLPSGDVLQGKPLVDIDGGVDFLHNRCRCRIEAPAPDGARLGVGLGPLFGHGRISRNLVVKRIVILALAAAIIAAAVGTIAFYAVDTQTASCGPVPEQLARFEAAEKLEPVDLSFNDGDGACLNLADYRGRGVVLNLWATWCPPCVREMPALDRLSAALEADDIAVLTVSGDRGGVPVVEQFYGEHRIENLPVLVDPGMKGSRGLQVAGLPTTLIVDRDGREIGRLAGAAEWDADAAVSFIRSCIDGESR